ncbi:MAG: S-adenosylmethionine:tRNA ribosyltransferase-isomerase [Siphonobacter sp.]
MTNIPISEFEYNLPDNLIARFPLIDRDRSRLLVYQHGQIQHAHFTDIISYLPEDSLLVFNNTKVIPARLFFRKTTGALIELFLLHPIDPTPVINLAMEVTDSCVWACMIGNRKRWKTGEVLLQETGGLTLQAELIDAEQAYVRLKWNKIIPFVEVVQLIGKVPLPPYLKREAEEQDHQTYQTVYSEKKGAVAAPTAGLHFTERVFHDLEAKGIKHEFLTLHVGAGTFQPVKTENALEHKMHGEQVVFTQANLEHLIAGVKRIIPVGTTSMRSLESLYWLGILINAGTISSLANGFIIPQFVHQTNPSGLAVTEALHVVLGQMRKENLTEIVGETSIMIYPGYTFRMCKGIITNFHQPGSTLMLLVAALVGEDWKQIYAEAVAREYRFLSYGDSSLLLP